MINMWLTNIENKEAVKGIYRDNIPSLNKIFLRNFNISTGQDLGLILVFDIEELPDDMPNKWKSQNVNTIQIVLNLVNIEVIHFGLNNINYKNLLLEISQLQNNSKKILGIDSFGVRVFELEAQWVYLKTITGYNNNEKATL